jgi:hypothetical protein
MQPAPLRRVPPKGRISPFEPQEKDMTETTRHDRIFLQVCDDDGEYERRGDITWCQDRIHDTDVEYIRKELHDQQISERDAQLLKNADLLGEAADALDHMEKQNVMLLDALINARHALQLANDTPNGPICDTIWMMHSQETLFDFMDATIARAKDATADLAGLVVCDAKPAAFVIEGDQDGHKDLDFLFSVIDPLPVGTKLYVVKEKS